LARLGAKIKKAVSDHGLFIQIKKPWRTGAALHGFFVNGFDQRWTNPSLEFSQHHQLLFEKDFIESSLEN
jgi:hypothetical protein